MSEKEQALSHGRLTRLLSYDRETGVFNWREWRSYRAEAGDEAGCIRPNGYRYICIDGYQYLGHRVAWFYVTGTWPKNQIDHINRQKADNRFANLREATGGQNQVNRSAKRGVGLKGTSFHKESGMWRAFAGKDGRKITIGQYTSAEAAHAAYLKVAAELHGEFSNG